MALNDRGVDIPCDTCKCPRLSLWKESSCDHHICVDCLNQTRDGKQCCSLGNVISLVLCIGQCGETFQRNQLDALNLHFRRCTVRPRSCPKCKKFLPFDSLARHSTTFCPKRQAQCPHCKRDDEFDHRFECPKRPVNCNLCSLQMPFESLRQHQDENCPAVPRACKFSKFGCTVEERRGSLLQHEISDHSDVFMSYTRRMQQESDQKQNKLSETVTSLNSNLNEMRRLVGQLQNQMQEVREENRLLRESVVILNNAKTSVEEKVNTLENSLTDFETMFENLVNQEPQEPEDQPPQEDHSASAIHSLHDKSFTWKFCFSVLRNEGTRIGSPPLKVHSGVFRLVASIFEYEETEGELTFTENHLLIALEILLPCSVIVKSCSSFVRVILVHGSSASSNIKNECSLQHLFTPVKCAKSGNTGRERFFISSTDFLHSLETVNKGFVIEDTVTVTVSLEGL